MSISIKNFYGSTVQANGFAFRIETADQFADPDVVDLLKALIAQEITQLSHTATRKLHRSELSADHLLDRALGHLDQREAFDIIPVTFAEWRRINRKHTKARRLIETVFGPV